MGSTQGIGGVAPVFSAPRDGCILDALFSQHALEDGLDAAEIAAVDGFLCQKPRPWVESAAIVIIVSADALNRIS
jgi:hypothetical protein